MIEANKPSVLSVVGKLEGALTYTHSVAEEKFYDGVLIVPRTSGVSDRIPVTFPGRLIEGVEFNSNLDIFVTGSLRSYNKVDENGVGHLSLTLFANEFSQNPVILGANEGLNLAVLTGNICRKPLYRQTPYGREICDFMVAVNRAFRKSDYIPCIAWGRNARYMSRQPMSTRVTVSGRFQSREYDKILADGTTVRKTAYELSVQSVDAGDND